MATTSPDRLGCDTSELVHIHAMFRRAFTDIPKLVRGVPDGDRTRTAVVAAHVAEFSDSLHTHHQGEDLLLWDKLEERAPSCALHVGRMRAQHAAVAELLGRLDERVPLWQASATAADGEKVGEVVDAIAGVLFPHLDQEETDVVPTAASVLSQREWDELGVHAQAATSKSNLLMRLGWILDGMDPAEQSAWQRRNLPAPIRGVWWAVGRRRFERHKALVYGR